MNGRPSGIPNGGRRLVVAAALTAVVMLALAGAAPVAANTISIRATWNVTYPKIDSDKIVWCDTVGLEDGEIFVYDIPTGVTTQITNDSNYDGCGWGIEPQVSDGKVVWVTWSSSIKHDIFMYDTATAVTTRITNSDARDSAPHIDAGKVVWVSLDDAGRRRVLLYDSVTGVTTQVATNYDGFDSGEQAIGSGAVAWLGNDWGVWHNAELFVSPGGQITYSNLGVFEPQIADGKLVWFGSDGSDSEIFMYDLATGVTTQVTDNGVQDAYPYTRGGKVVWAGGLGGTDTEIFMYDSATGVTTQVTNNSWTDHSPRTDGKTIVWNGYDGNDYEIVVYDIATGVTTQITNNNYIDSSAEISDGRVVWHTNEYRIYLWDPSLDHDIAALSIVSSATSIAPGQSADFTVVVKNEGTMSESFLVTVSEAPDGVTIASDAITLAAGASATSTYTWITTASTTVGNHVITASVPPVSGETDTADNAVTTGVGVARHDIAVSAVVLSSASLAQGQSVDVAVSMSNEGSVSEAFALNVAESPDGVAIADDPITLEAGALITKTYTWLTTAATTLGSHTITAGVTTLAGETDTADNSSSAAVTVMTPPVIAVDLVKKRAWPQRHHFVISKDVDGKQTLYGRLANTGTAAARASVEFIVRDSNTGAVVATVFSATAMLATGAELDVSADWLPSAGKYSVDARAHYDSDGDGTLDAYGAVKSFSFAVVP